MNTIEKGPIASLGFDFVDTTHLEPGRDEITFRNAVYDEMPQWRHLTRRERTTLIRNHNRADNWRNILVADGFRAEAVWNSAFFGINRIGAHGDSYLEFHDQRLPIGIYNSMIVSSDIGDNCAIHQVHYLSRYIIGSEVVLFNIDEMITTSYAKFGNGILKDGEDESVRIWLEVSNENAGRKILPFDGLTPADAYLWSRNRENVLLQTRLKEMTTQIADGRRGHFGTVGDSCVIKSCRIIKDVAFGEHAYVKGANKLKNLTVKSRKGASTQIGEGVELVNGIIEIGCRVFYGVKAVRFCLRTNASLKYGARLLNSILGDNGTISCCEVLNSIVYPAHEQHHNNSFLVAATVQGQSNVAAGATLGSNHNSRANDGEIFASRGFWPGLCVNLKHSSKFASFCLIAKGNYPSELNIELPFTLVSNDETQNKLVLMPGYWFRYNMYALARNSWKYGDRDQKLYQQQVFEYEYLAPDTVEEMFRGVEILELMVGLQELDDQNEQHDIRAAGRKLFADGSLPAEVSVQPDGIEANRRGVLIRRIAEGYQDYRDMIHLYGIKTVAAYAYDEGIDSLQALVDSLQGGRRCRWINLGGQLVAESDYLTLIDDIASGKIDSWGGVHAEYGRLGQSYRKAKAKHAIAALLHLHEIDSGSLSQSAWREWLDRGSELQRVVLERTKESRGKDYQNEFKRMMYESDAEMNQVLGTLEDNSFIRELDIETAGVIEMFRAVGEKTG